jgi:hypothetical protein
MYLGKIYSRKNLRDLFALLDGMEFPWKEQIGFDTLISETGIDKLHRTQILPADQQLAEDTRLRTVPNWKHEWIDRFIADPNAVITAKEKGYPSDDESDFTLSEFLGDLTGIESPVYTYQKSKTFQLEFECCEHTEKIIFGVHLTERNPTSVIALIQTVLKIIPDAEFIDPDNDDFGDDDDWD